MISEPVRPDSIPEIFPIIRPYLEDIRIRAGGPPPDELFDDLINGRLTLHAYVGEGFCIVDWSDNDFHVVSAACTEKVTSVGICGIISKATKYAKQHGCCKMTFSSGRKAWSRLASRLGFTLEGDLFTKEL